MSDKPWHDIGPKHEGLYRRDQHERYDVKLFQKSCNARSQRREYVAFLVGHFTAVIVQRI